MCTQDPILEPRYKNIPQSFRLIVKEEGFRALYRGLIPALFGVSHGALQFMVYEELKTLTKPKDSVEDKATSKSRFLEYVFMAISSKTVATVVTYPYQTVKSRLQQATQSAQMGIIDIIKFVYSKEGLRGFYRGLPTNLVRLMPGTISTFLIYEVVLDHLKQNYTNIYA